MLPKGGAGLILILSAPSGGGKSTLARLLVSRRDDVETSVSHTTRDMRGEEVNGEAYHFVDTETFEAMIAQGEFAEYAQVYDRYYGTSKAEIERIRSLGCHVILDIDTQGGFQVMEAFPEAVSVFIVPPSMEVLEGRLRGRDTDSEEAIQKRLFEARSEMAAGQKYEHTLVNDDLGEALQGLIEILDSEEKEIFSPEGYYEQ
jgi:guanylate kinase